MDIISALQETGKAKRDKWGEKEYIYKQGMYFIDNEGKPFNREDIAQDVWQPYYEEKEIRPENAGELWEGPQGDIFMSTNRNTAPFVDVYGESISLSGVVHNKNGWDRLYPPVEDDSVETIEIENIGWDLCEEWQKKPMPFIITGEHRGNKEWGYIRACVEGKPPMKMILEIPKEG